MALSRSDFPPVIANYILPDFPSLSCFPSVPILILNGTILDLDRYRSTPETAVPSVHEDCNPTVSFYPGCWATRPLGNLVGPVQSTSADQGTWDYREHPVPHKGLPI